ncbi:MAG: hypothetical protein WBB25_16385, partial [Sulfitobacter sp.]
MGRARAAGERPTGPKTGEWRFNNIGLTSLEIAHLIGYGSHKEVRNHLILSKQITAQSNGWDSFDRIGPRM